MKSIHLQRTAIYAILLLALAGLWYATRFERYGEPLVISGPRITIVAEYRRFHAWIPILPGDGGMKPGRLVILKDGELIDR